MQVPFKARSMKPHHAAVKARAFGSSSAKVSKRNFDCTSETKQNKSMNSFHNVQVELPVIESYSRLNSSPISSSRPSPGIAKPA